MGVLLEGGRLAPPQVVILGPHPDIAEDSAEIAMPHFARAIDVVEDFMVVEGKEGRRDYR